MSVKFKPSKDFDKIINDVAIEGIKANGFEMQCPECNETIHVVVGDNKCPHCGFEFKTGFGPEKS